MECYYDTLFEADCAGIAELMNVPCAYNYGAIFFAMRKPWEIATRFTYVDKKLFKKAEWIAKCGSFSSGYFHRFISRKSPIVRYILEVKNKYEWYERGPGFWDYKTMPCVPSCYYLGTYPVYWNADNKGIAYPDNLGTANNYPLQPTPVIPRKLPGMTAAQSIEKLTKEKLEAFEFLPDVDKGDMKDTINEFGLENVLNYLNPSRIKKVLSLDEQSALRELNSKIDQTMSHLTLRYDKDLLGDYFIQDNWFTKRAISFKECLARAFPKKPKEPTTTVLTPRGPAEFPGIPMNELTKPTPERQPQPFPFPRQRLFNLIVSFGIKQGVAYNALDLKIQLLEI